MGLIYLIERFAEDAGLLAKVRQYLWKMRILLAKLLTEKKQKALNLAILILMSRLLMYLLTALAMFRGRNEGILQLSLNSDPQFEEAPKESYGEQLITDI